MGGRRLLNHRWDITSYRGMGWEGVEWGKTNQPCLDMGSSYLGIIWRHLSSKTKQCFCMYESQLCLGWHVLIDWDRWSAGDSFCCRRIGFTGRSRLWIRRILLFVTRLLLCGVACDSRTLHGRGSFRNNRVLPVGGGLCSQDENRMGENEAPKRCFAFSYYWGLLRWVILRNSHPYGSGMKDEDENSL